MQQALGGQVVSVGVAGAFAGEHPDAATGAGALRGRFDNLLVDAQRGCRNRLKVEVGIVATGAEGLAKAALKQPFGYAKLFKKIPGMTGSWGSGRSCHRALSLRLKQRGARVAPVADLIQGKVRP